jgi:tRNA(Ile)-lysidine synthase
MARLEALVRRALAGLPGLERGVVAAVSGGPDSVALLRALLAVRPAASPWPLSAAHLNHALRGADSDSDEAFVIGLCAGLGVPLSRHRLDVGALARAEGGNLEDVARRERYRWLADVAQNAGAAWVATGHTASDQAETVLHRLLRGAGLTGLRGIAGRRELAPGVDLVRPLLRVRRVDVTLYLGSLGQPARQDASNADLRFTRNRIRHELLPHLAARYNPAVEAALARLAEQADEACRSKEEEAAALLATAELPRAGPVLVFDAARLAAAPARLVRAAFRLVWRREGWPRGRMGCDDWRRLADLAAAAAGAVDLPGHVTARRRGGALQLRRAPESQEPTVPGE